MEVSTLRVAALAFGLAAGANWIAAQPATFHRISGVEFREDRTVQLLLTGTAPSTFRNYYDLFPIETSSDLVQWQPLITIVRTNALTNLLSFVDSGGWSKPIRFYRAPTNILVTPLPRPSGPYTVGRATRLVSDGTRTNRYGVPTNSSFMVTFWYPAKPTAGVLPVTYTDHAVATSDYAGSLGAVYQAARAWAKPDIPIAAEPKTFPVVFFSHGYGQVRTECTDKTEDLASHGFVVVAPDHADARVTVFPNGRALRTVAPPPPISLAARTRYLRERVLDFQFLLQELVRINENDSLFAGRLDLERIGVFGFSFGGATAAHICSAELGVRAGLSLDGAGHTGLSSLGVRRPFLIASGTRSDGFLDPLVAPYRAEFRQFYDQLETDAYWLQIANSAHLDFNETPWFQTPASTGKIRIASYLRTCATSFFNKHLRGIDDHFLDGASEAYPEVDVFLRK